MNRKFIYPLCHGLLIVCCAFYYQLYAVKATAIAPIFDAYFCFLAIYCVFVSKSVVTGNMLIFLLAISLFGMGFTIRYFQFNDQIDYYAYFRACRFLYYLFIFVIVGEIAKFSLSARFKTPQESFQLLFEIVAYLSIGAYLFRMVVLRDSRPELYAENNFEVPALILFMLAVAATNFDRLPSFKLRAAVYPSSFLSLSKSGILEAGFVIAQTNLKRPKIQHVP